MVCHCRHMMPLAKFTRGSAWPVYLLSPKSLRTRGRRPPPFLFAPSPRLPSAHDLPAPAHDPYMQRKQKLVLVSRSDQRSRVATSAFTDSGTPPTPHLYSCPDRSTPPTLVTMPSLFTLTITLYRDPSCASLLPAHKTRVSLIPYSAALPPYALQIQIYSL